MSSLRLPPVALLFGVVLVAYAPSLWGPHLNWDDPWLILSNPLLHDASAGALSRMFLDLTRETRLVLGAEYLPLRDLSVWLELHLFGDAALPQRLVNLALYLWAVALLRRAFRSALGDGLPAEIATLVFALHPAHVESVAWLAGRKDVLGLLFTSGALAVYSTAPAGRRWLVPLLLGAAHFSKSVTVVGVGLLLAQDLLMRRRPAWDVLLVSLLVAAVALAVHVRVGTVVGMTTDFPGGSRFATFLTLGPMLLRYVVMSVWPPALSLVHDVRVVETVTLAAGSAWVLVAVALVGALAALHRRGDGRALAVCMWFLVPLLPVSHVLFPLQNLMADRYLLLSVGAISLLSGWVASRPGRASAAVWTSLLVVSFAGTVYRASLFSDSRAVFADALDKTQESPTPAYQLGQAFEANGDDRAAMDAYVVVLSRQPGANETSRRATNNLARLRARHGDLSGAEEVLRRGRVLFPGDPKMLSNLARVLARMGREAEAAALFDELGRRHPGYGGGAMPEGLGGD